LKYVKNAKIDRCRAKTVVKLVERSAIGKTIEEISAITGNVRIYGLRRLKKRSDAPERLKDCDSAC